MPSTTRRRWPPRSTPGRTAEGRAIARLRGLERTRMDASPFADDTVQRGWLERCRLRVPASLAAHDPPVDPTETFPPLREGVTVRRVARHENGVPVASGPADRAPDAGGVVPGPLQLLPRELPEFVQRLREDPGHRWDHWWLAFVSTGADAGRRCRPGRSSARSWPPTRPAPRAPTSTTSASTGRPAGVAWPRVCCTPCSRTPPSGAATGSRLEVDADSPTSADGLYLLHGVGDRLRDRVVVPDVVAG